jgi:hypothetical protein
MCTAAGGDTMAIINGSAGDNDVAQISYYPSLSARVGSPAEAGRRRENHAALRWGASLAFAFCLVLPQARADERPTFPDFERGTFELLPYQGSGYRFRVLPLDEEPPVGFEQPGFDDTAFDRGDGAFGSSGVCPLQSSVATEWPVNTQIIVRRTISVPADVRALRVMISVDNDIVGVFFNGTPTADFIAHDDCPIRDEFRLDVPPELVQPGEIVVTFHVLDRGGESFFDARILADLTVTPPPVAASKTIRCKDGQQILVTTNTRGGKCEQVGDAVGCRDGANIAIGRCLSGPFGFGTCVETQGSGCCRVCGPNVLCLGGCPEKGPA